ncbi:putative NTP pyrophosphohydrolase MazG catalytic core domain-containing protein [uncultured Thiomicrorhabdus sp.]
MLVTVYIYTESDAQQQVSKTLEEVAELVGNVSRIQAGDVFLTIEQDDIKDDIGDIMVCLTHVAQFYGLNLKECYQHAYNEIKDREGRMVNGKFIKESNLKENYID